MIFIFLILFSNIFGCEKFKLKNLRTFLINLNHRVDKYEASKYQLQSLGLVFERFTAVNGKELIEGVRNKSDNVKVFTGIQELKMNSSSLLLSKLTPAQIGCWLSHLKLQNYIMKAEEKGKMFLILEDDFIADGSSVELMKKLVEEAPDNWDLLYVGHCNGRDRCEKYINSGNKICSTTKIVYCTHGYLLKNYSVAKTLFEKGNTVNPNIADFYFQLTLLKRFLIFPHIFKQRKNIESDVKSKGGIFTKLINNTFEILLSEKNV